MAIGCGSAMGPVGRSQPTPTERPLELTLRRPTGEWIHLGDLRGKPLLLFFFATFDGASQAALRPLGRFAREYPDVQVIGVAVQENAGQLVDAYDVALTPPFPLTFDPTDDLIEGTTPLGTVDTIPRFRMFDARGFVVDEHRGFPNSRTLERLRELALERGGIAVGGEVPLIGQSPR